MNAFLAWPLAFLLLNSLSPTTTGTVNFVVHHPAAKNADVRIALYNSSETWLEEPAHAQIEAATDTLTTVSFTDVPFGQFGAAIYLDENRNGKLDRNLVGWFKEPFGFSRDARVRFGPPEWDDAIFEVTEEDLTLTIILD